MSIRQLELQNVRQDWGCRENQPQVVRLEVTEDELFMRRPVQKKRCRARWWKIWLIRVQSLHFITEMTVGVLGGVSTGNDCLGVTI